jgi:hypothetical protein
MFFYQKILHVTVFVCLFSFNLSAQNIDFSDINLKSALLNHAPKVDMNNDNEISIEEANLITELKLSNKNIVSIEDLVVFDNLKKLRVDTNAITEIPIVLLQKLSYLSIVKNQISQITNLGSNSLDTLFIQNNLLSSANFQNYQKLSNLNISNNPIFNVKIEGLSNLKSFTFSDTKLKTLNFTGLSNLTNYFGNITLDTLYAQSGLKLITSNDIWKVTVLNYDFSNNPDFISFTASWNLNSFNLNCKNCVNLELVNLNNARVNSLNLDDCNNLTNLSFNYQHSTTINYVTTKNCSKIKYFSAKSIYFHRNYNIKVNLFELLKYSSDLEYIHVSYVEDEDLDFLNSFPNLASLYLETNKDLNSLSLKNLNKLKDVFINGVKKVFIEECDELTEIKSNYKEDGSPVLISDSLSIKSCPKLISIGTIVKNLKVFNCPKFNTFTSMSLQNIWFDSCDAFKTFPSGWWKPDFKTSLKSLQVTNCKGIENLNISWPSSKINFINIDGSSNLKELHVAGHNLETVDLSTNTKLEKIFLQNNNLKSLNISHLPNLNTLNIANNANLLYVDLNYDHQLSKLYISGMNKGFFACVENPSDVNIDSVFVDADGIKRFYNCDTIVFKDKILEQVLLNFNPPIDTNNDRVISMFEAKNFTKLVLSDLGINFTDGLEFFRNLDTLILNNNYVQTFNAINFSGLKYLDLSSNILAHLILNREKSEITESTKDLVVLQQTLDSTYNSTLQTLLLNNNQLKELDVTKVVNLNYLNTQNNPLIGVCVNQNQLDNWVNVWDKDAQAIWSTNCDEVTSSNYIQQNLAPAYPNPAQNYIYINAPATGIIDINGKLVQNISANAKYIPLQLSPGLYFIQYQNGKVEKLIVQ